MLIKFFVLGGGGGLGFSGKGGCTSVLRAVAQVTRLCVCMAFGEDQALVSA